MSDTSNQSHLIQSQWLNYNHLYYFWVVAQQGSVTRAAEELRLSQPTISEQLQVLEESLGEKLFERVGRGLVLTSAGEIALKYANQIFPLGKELRSAIKGSLATTELVVGIADVLPKLVAYKLLEPARKLSTAGESKGQPKQAPTRIICREGRPERLAADLALNELHLVLSDSPLTKAGNTKIYSQLLGQCSISLFASTSLASRYKRKFPASLNNAPFLLPSEDSVMRKSMETWFRAHNIRPDIVAEFADSALLSIYGEAGDGIFPVPSIIESDCINQKGLKLVGRLKGVKERYYAIASLNSRKHPAVLAVTADSKSSF